MWMKISMNISGFNKKKISLFKIFSTILVLNFHVTLTAKFRKCPIYGKFSFRLAGAVKIDTREQYVNPTGLCFPVYKCSRHANVIIVMIFSRMDFALITMKRIYW